MSRRGFQHIATISAMTADEDTGAGEYDICRDVDGFYVVADDDIIGDFPCQNSAIAEATRLAGNFDRNTTRH